MQMHINIHTTIRSGTKYNFRRLVQGYGQDPNRYLCYRICSPQNLFFYFSRFLCCNFHNKPESSTVHGFGLHEECVPAKTFQPQNKKYHLNLPSSPFALQPLESPRCLLGMAFSPVGLLLFPSVSYTFHLPNCRSPNTS